MNGLDFGTRQSFCVPQLRQLVNRDLCLVAIPVGHVVFDAGAGLGAFLHQALQTVARDGVGVDVGGGHNCGRPSGAENRPAILRMFAAINTGNRCHLWCGTSQERSSLIE
jgi:hypothetical protein